MFGPLLKLELGVVLRLREGRASRPLPLPLLAGAMGDVVVRNVMGFSRGSSDNTLTGECYSQAYRHILSVPGRELKTIKPEALIRGSRREKGQERESKRGDALSGLAQYKMSRQGRWQRAGAKESWLSQVEVAVE